MTNWYCYILLCNDSNGSYYIGITNNVQKRLEKHNNGKASKYTRGRLPVKLIYTEMCATKSDALKREYVIKQLSRKQKEDLVSGLNELNRINRV